MPPEFIIVESSAPPLLPLLPLRLTHFRCDHPMLFLPTVRPLAISELSFTQHADSLKLDDCVRSPPSHLVVSAHLPFFFSMPP